MARKKWDYYKVAQGTALTASKKSLGAFRGLVHGRKGIKTHAEFFKVDKGRSIFGWLMAFAAKTVIAVLGVAAVVAVVAVLVSAVADGVAAGLAEVRAAVSAASEYLVIGAGVVTLLAVGAVGVKLARFFMRRRGDKLARRDRSGDALAAVPYVAPAQVGIAAVPAYNAAPAFFIGGQSR